MAAKEFDRHSSHAAVAECSRRNHRHARQSRRGVHAGFEQNFGLARVPRNNRFDPRYRDVLADLIPRSECLKDVVTRATPYLRDVISEDVRSEGVKGGAVLIVAHGNSIRALRMVLENIGEDEITDIEIPTGIPYRLTLDHELNVLGAKYLGDAEAAARAAEAVARQAG